MANRETLWVFRVEGNVSAYVAHPRGEITRDLDKAYGWYYKKDAEKWATTEWKHSGQLVLKRRCDFRE
jgi:hypothetical protein